MITAPDFSKKQIVFIFFNEGEKLAFSNDNLIVKNSDGKVKFQITCYRLFIIYAVGNFSITSVLIQKAKKFGFFVALFTSGFRLYDVIGANKDGNTLLRRQQYYYDDIGIAKHIVKNKILTQYQTLKDVRNKSESVKEAMQMLYGYYSELDNAENYSSVLAYEGLSSKVYFKNHFNNVLWSGRKPRIKSDIINSILDIGYTLLFAFFDALLCAFGFDTYCGVLHKEFYMRKSLVCDFIEPFRSLIDKCIKSAYNLKQIQEDDFSLINHKYVLKWDKSPEYISFLMKPIIENKNAMFKYVLNYYRCFMKQMPISEFPIFLNGEILNDFNKL